ncbi:MAG: polymer-forming cytoskeletal protein [Proteobacteria bacterium]|nr:polymer-forming cytoskeletal protein [Pseudomonadota bacterium]
MNAASNSADAATGIPPFLAKGESKVTVIGEKSNLVGDISSRQGEELLVEGCVVGSIFHDGKVVIGGTGVVFGSVFAADLEVHGVVDAAEGEILAANLVVRGTSRIKAGEVTVATGCMNYERGGFMNAQLGMIPAAEVNARIETLLDGEIQKATSRRQAIEKARAQVKVSREAAKPAAQVQTFEPAPEVAATHAGEQQLAPASVASEFSAPVASAAPATLRAAIALVPAVVDSDEEGHADVPRAAYGS